MEGNRVINADCLDWMKTQPDNSVDLVFGSPPYEAARTYGIGFKLRGQEWVDWMVERIVEMVRICKGLVAMVVEGQTRGYRWSATPALLIADLHRRGIVIRKPPIFHRVGVSGSGGKRAQHEANGGSADWLRNDYEFIVCCAKGGKLPWADTLAMGHTPKWAPGGEMSNRVSSGARVNQWGHSFGTGGTGGPIDDITCQDARPSHCVAGRDQWGGTGHATGGEGRKVNGEFKTRRGKMARMIDAKGAEPKVAAALNGEIPNGSKLHTKNNGDTMRVQCYTPPAIANPGNVIKCKVGGGVMGSRLCHENEAPFPERLAEFFVRSFCPPGGIVLDPFSGSGTTARVAQRHGRQFIALDVRQSQCDLTLRRLAEPEKPAKKAKKTAPVMPSQRSLFS